jgi:hypothetical protein
MLAVRDLRRVAWRRRHAHQHYAGYLTLTDDTIRLSGRESATGIDVALSIPHQAINSVRIGTTADDQLAGEPAVVLEVADGAPILIRPIDTGRFEIDALARRLASAVEPMRPRAAAC